MEEFDRLSNMSTIYDPDDALVRHWQANLDLPTPLPVTIAVGGLIVTGRPVRLVSWYQVVSELQADQAEIDDDLGLANQLRQEAGTRSARLTEEWQGGSADEDSEYFHFAEADIFGAGPARLHVWSWRCPKRQVTGWTFGRPVPAE